MGTLVSLYGGRDPREVPMYSVSDAAVYLRVAKSTLAAWIGRKSYSVKDGGQRRMKPLIVPDRKTGMLTWNNLVEAYALASLRKKHDVPLPIVRRALDRHLKVDRPLLHMRGVFLTDGFRGLYVHDGQGNLEDAAFGQLAMPDVVAARLERVEVDDHDLPTCLYPWYSDPSEEKTIALDPRRGFGRPTVVESSAKIEVLIDRYLAGETADELSASYNLPRARIDGVIRWSLAEKRAA